VDSQLAALDYWLKPLHPEQMPDVATALLVAGYDSPSLREAAGLSAEDPITIREVFSQALKELGVWFETRNEAAVHAAKDLAKDYVMGQLSIRSLVREVLGLWEFDEVVYDAVPPEAERLAWLAQAYGNDLYDELGGDEALEQAAASLAFPSEPPAP
jgi:hypothetical protein